MWMIACLLVAVVLAQAQPRNLDIYWVDVEGGAAGLKKIDYFVLSHFHADHAGGLVALSKMIPIGRCFDRGDFIEPAIQRWRDA